MKTESEKFSLAIRTAVQDYEKQFGPRPVPLPLALAEQDFFLECIEGILWGRILKEPLSFDLLRDLLKESDLVMKRITRDYVRPFILFPCLGEDFKNPQWKKELKAMELEIPGNFKFMKYDLVFQASDPHVTLKECPLFSEKETQGTLSSFSSKTDQRFSSSPRVLPHFFERSRLSQDELSDLLDLAIELRCS